MMKIFNYKTLGMMLKSLADACFKADEQQSKGEPVTACGMSDEEIDKVFILVPLLQAHTIICHNDHLSIDGFDVKSDNYWRENGNQVIEYQGAFYMHNIKEICDKLIGYKQ